jgi:hypothetical protein
LPRGGSVVDSLLWSTVCSEEQEGPQPELDALVKIEFKSVRKFIEFVRKVQALKAEHDSCNRAI